MQDALKQANKRASAASDGRNSGSAAAADGRADDGCGAAELSGDGGGSGSTSTTSSVSGGGSGGGSGSGCERDVPSAVMRSNALMEVGNELVETRVLLAETRGECGDCTFFVSLLRSVLLPFFCACRSCRCCRCCRYPCPLPSPLLARSGAAERAGERQRAGPAAGAGAPEDAGLHPHLRGACSAAAPCDGYTAPV